MIKELYEIRTRENSAVFVNSRLSAVKKRDLKKTGFRVYENGKIGISYAEGDYVPDSKFNEAAEMLEFKLPYPSEPTKNHKKSMDMTSENSELSKEEFIYSCQEVISELDKSFPDIIFANTISMIDQEYSLQNDCDLDLHFKDRYYLGEISMKVRDGINIVDSAIPYKSRKFEPKQIIESTKRIYANFRKEIEIEENKKYPLIISTNDMFNLYYGFINTCFSRELNGQFIAQGASIFSNSIGKQLLSENFTLYQQSNPKEYIGRPFFDTEGTVIDGGVVDFIENGNIIKPFTDKTTAKKYNYEITGSAGGNPDEIPNIGFLDNAGIPRIRPLGLTVKGSDKTITELLGGEKGIFVSFSLGGAYSDGGSYAFPIQYGLVFDGNEFIGRTQQLLGSTTIFDMYGPDWRGVGINDIIPASQQEYMVLDMVVENNR